MRHLRVRPHRPGHRDGPNLWRHGNLGHLFEHDPVTDTSTDLREALPDQSMVLALLVGLDGCVDGGSDASNLDGHLFRFDPSDPSTVTDLGAPVPGSAEIGSLTLPALNAGSPPQRKRYSAEGTDGLIYGATADQDILFSYDPVHDKFDTEGSATGISSIDCLTTGPDGNLYGGGYPSGGLFVFAPTAHQGAFLGAPVLGEYAVEALVAGLNGKLYGGTRYSKGYLFSYDIYDGNFAVYGAPVWRDTNLISLLRGSDGIPYGGTGSTQGHLFRFGLANQRYSESGRAASISIAPRMHHKTYVPAASEVRALTVASDGWVYASGYSSPPPAKLSRWNPATGGLMELLGNVPGWPSTVYDPLEGPDGKIYGGGCSFGTTPNLFGYDPATGTFAYLSPGMVNQNYMYALTLCPDGRIYGGTGGNGSADGELVAHDLADGTFVQFGPVVAGETAVRSLICVPDGTLYGGTGPNAQGFKFHPMGGRADLGQPLQGETRLSALILGPDGRLYGGTTGSGRLFCYDLSGGTVTDLGQPYAGDTEIDGLEVGTDGRLYGVTGSVEGHLLVYDPDGAAQSDLGKVYPAERNAYSLAHRCLLGVAAPGQRRGRGSAGPGRFAAPGKSVSGHQPAGSFLSYGTGHPTPHFEHPRPRHHPIAAGMVGYLDRGPAAEGDAAQPGVPGSGRRPGARPANPAPGKHERRGAALRSTLCLRTGQAASFAVVDFGFRAAGPARGRTDLRHRARDADRYGQRRGVARGGLYCHPALRWPPRLRDLPCGRARDVDALRRPSPGCDAAGAQLRGRARGKRRR